MFCEDVDIDGFGVCPLCNSTLNCTYDGNDCNDNDLDINPIMPEFCNNIVDDDCDGLIDCDDPDCEISIFCSEPEIECNDGLDNNNNGLTDCADINCKDEDKCSVLDYELNKGKFEVVLNILDNDIHEVEMGIVFKNFPEAGKNVEVNVLDNELCEDVSELFLGNVSTYNFSNVCDGCEVECAVDVECKISAPEGCPSVCGIGTCYSQLGTFFKDNNCQELCMGSVECIDNDLLNYLIKSNAVDSDLNTCVDFCDGNILHECYCNNGVKQELVDCRTLYGVCTNGACVINETLLNESLQGGTFVTGSNLSNITNLGFDNLSLINNSLTNETITETNITNGTLNVTLELNGTLNETVDANLTELPDQIKEDPEFEVFPIESYMNGTDLIVIFYHNSSSTQPIRVDGNVNYTLSRDSARGNVNITLVVYNWDDEYFRLVIGDHSGAFQFGKQKDVKVKTNIKDSEGKKLNVDIEILDSLLEQSVVNVSVDTKKDKSIDFNVKEGKYQIKVKVKDKNLPIKEIVFEDVEIYNDLNDFVDIDFIDGSDPKFADYDQVYAIDPTNVNFTTANVTVTATGNILYKCADWNFTMQECQGSWIKYLDIIPGQNYTFELGPDDPGYGEILITDGVHLDSDRNFIEDVYSEVQYQDDVWTDPIPVGDYIRVKYEKNLTNDNDITLYARSSGTARIEVYPMDQYDSVATFDSITTADTYKEFLTSMTDGENYAWFDLKILDNPIEFDYITDPDTVAGSPGTVVSDDTVGTEAWTNPDRVDVSDDRYAEMNPAFGYSLSHYLKATNFGASIPTDATIDGILVEIERYADETYTVKDVEVKIVKSDGSIGTENKANTADWWLYSDDDSYKSYGGSDDLWSEEWTAGDINDADFGVALSVSNEGMFVGYVDHIRITVYYTEAPSSPNITLFTDSDTTNFSAVGDMTAVPLMTLADSKAKIRWANNVDADGEDYDTHIDFGAGFVSVNTSALKSTINSSANITLKDTPCPIDDKIYSTSGVYSSSTDIISNGFLCDAGSNPSCTNIACSGGDVTFTVSHFTGYASGPTANMTIWDDTETLTKYVNDSIKFYANYTNSTNDTITADCNVRFDTGSGYGSWYDMSLNGDTYEYNSTAGFPSAGNFDFEVNCTNTLNYSNLTANDSFVVSSHETSWFSPSAYENDNRITNPSNAYSNDDIYVDFWSYSATYSRADYKTFAFTGLSGTIDGIKVQFDGKDAGDPEDTWLYVYLSGDGGSTFTTPKNLYVSEITEVTDIFGSSTDDWDGTWSSANFSDANFRVKVEQHEVDASYDLDHLQVKVYYTKIPYTGCVDLSDESTYDYDGDNIDNVVKSGVFYYINDNVTLCTDTYSIPAASEDPAITMNASNIYLDCDGSTIVGSGAAGFGVYSFEKAYTNVSNCNFKDYKRGIYWKMGTNYSYISNITINSSSMEGLVLMDSSHNIFSNITVYDSNDAAIMLSDNCDNNTFVDSMLYNNSNTEMGAQINFMNTMGDPDDNVFNNTFMYGTAEKYISIVASPPPQDTGPISPGTVVDDNSVGTVEWLIPGNAKVSDDSQATASGTGWKEDVIRLVKDGSVYGDDKSGILDIGTTWYADTYYSYGSSSALWGGTWSAEDINDENFGVVISLEDITLMTSHYLKATNFSFSIPTGSTITGISVEVEGGDLDTGTVDVDHIRITVHYTEPSSHNQTFNNLTVANTTSLGQVNWKTLEINDATLAVANLKLEPDFVSMNSSDETVAQFNEAANVTINVTDCEDYGFYKLSGFPENASIIQTTGASYYPSYTSSCTSNTVTFSVSSFSGYATGEAPYVGCVNISDTATYQGIVVNNSGNYVITGNVTLCTDTYSLAVGSGAALEINASDVELDCNDSIITGGGHNGFGVYNFEYPYTNVSNCNFKDYKRGIYWKMGTNYSYISNITINSSSMEGLVLMDSSHNIFSNITVYDSNDAAIMLSDNCDNNTFVDSMLYNNSNTEMGAQINFMNTMGDPDDNVFNNTFMYGTAEKYISIVASPPPQDTGPISPGTVVDDNSVGTVEWLIPGNAKVSDDSQATASGTGWKEDVIRLVKDGSVYGDDKSGILDIGTTWYADTYYSYGSSSALWGGTWSAEDINDENFGVVISLEDITLMTSHYLKATNFSFSIPTGSTITGISVEVEGGDLDTGTVDVDHIRITVHYTEPSSHNQTFNNLTVANTTSLGQVNWKTLEINDATLAVANLKLEPDFVSMNSSDETVAQFNEAANVTINVTDCEDYGFYKLSGFPENASIIQTTGASYYPSYTSSCTSNTVTFSVSSFSGYATGEAPYVGCVNISDTATYQGIVVNNSGNYVITGNVTLCTDTYSLAVGSGAALEINASDVELDCNNSIITGGGHNGFGVRAEHLENVNITNCEIKNYQKGITVRNVSRGYITNNEIHLDDAGIECDGNISNFTISNNEIYLTDGVGIGVMGSSDNNITSNLIYSNKAGGLEINDNSDDNIFLNNTLYNNTLESMHREIYFGGMSGEPDNNVFTDTFIYDTSYIYIQFDSGLGSTHNQTFNNLTIGYNSTIGLVNWETLELNNVTLNQTNLMLDPEFISLNTSEDVAVQFDVPSNVTIYNNGTCTNLWYYSLAGYPQTRDAIIAGGTPYSPAYTSCDAGTDIATFSVTGWSGYTIDRGYYTGCVDLTNSSTYDYDGDTVDNIVNSSDGTAIFYINDDVTLCPDTYLVDASDGDKAFNFNCSDCSFDCNNSIINGTDDDGYGFYLASENEINLSNCNVYNYSKSITIGSGSNHFLTNNTVKYNEYGIHLVSTTTTTLTNNTANLNKYYGFYLSSSSTGNTLTNNTANSNGGGGLDIFTSSNNIFSYNIFNLNEASGIKFYDNSNGNTFSYTSINSNDDSGIQFTNSSDNSFTHSTVYSNQKNGIFITVNSTANTFVNTTLYSNGQASSSYYEISFDYDDAVYPDTNVFNDTFIYDNTEYLKTDVDFTSAHNNTFNNLTLGYNSTMGWIHWPGQLQVNNFDLDADSIKLGADFASINSSDSSAVQFNVTANITITYDDCDMPLFVLSGLPENSSIIQSDGSECEGCSKLSCADGSAVWEVPSWSGYSEGSNTAPSVVPGLTPAIIYFDTNANCTVNVTDDHSATCDVYFEWYVNDATVLNETVEDLANATNASSILNYGNFSVTDEINCTVYADDSLENSTRESVTTTVANYVPSLTAPVLIPSTVYTDTDVNCSTTVTDGDSEASTVYFAWYVDGRLMFSQNYADVASDTEKISTLDNSYYSTGATINCTVYANDGTDNSTFKNVTTPVEAYGNINITITDPTEDLDVHDEETFYVNATLTCEVGGNDCGDVVAILDPLDDWDYRKIVTVTENNGDTIDNYPVRIDINTTDYVTAGKMQSTCADLRFTDVSGTALSYWIEDTSTCNNAGENTIVWVKILSLAADSESSINMYYGNSDASAETNGENVFDYFDDGTSDKSANYLNPAGTTLVYDSGNDEYDFTITGASKNADVLIDIADRKNFAIYAEFAYRTFGAGAQNTQFGLIGRYVDSNNWIRGRVNDYNGASSSRIDFYKDLSGVFTEFDTTLYSSDVGLNNWESVELKMYYDNVSFESSYQDYDESADLAGTLDHSDGLGLFMGYDVNSQISFKNVRVRSYVLNEPTVSVGSEITKFIIPETSGSPFYTSSDNPVEKTDDSCLEAMEVGEECSISWLVTVNTSEIDTYDFFVIALNQEDVEFNSTHWDVNLANSDPTIISVSQPASLDPGFCVNVSVDAILVNVTDDNGADTINITTGYVNFTNGDVTIVSDSCTNASSGTYWIQLNCTGAQVRYWDSSGFWAMTVYLEDDDGANATNDSLSLTYNEASNLNVSNAITFGSVNVGSNNNSMTGSYNITNCGNTPLDTNITGANISDGAGHYLLATQFYINDNASIGEGTKDPKQLSVASQSYSKPDGGLAYGLVGSTWDIWFFLTIPEGQEVGTYNVGSFQWTPYKYE